MKAEKNHSFQALSAMVNAQLKLLFVVNIIVTFHSSHTHLRVLAGRKLYYFLNHLTEV